MFITVSIKLQGHGMGLIGRRAGWARTKYNKDNLRLLEMEDGRESGGLVGSVWE